MAANVSSIRTVSIHGLKRAAMQCIKAGRPFMIWGPPGVGKSDAVAQLCESMGGFMYDVRLSLMEPTDLRGMPYFNKLTNRMEWAPPVDLPDEETCSKYPVVFLFLDELVGAVPSVQAAAYQLILNRQVGTYKLPKNVVVCAAGNRDGDGGVTYRMPKPLMNRLVHFEVRCEFASWKEWAISKKIHSDVIGYLSWSEDSLYQFDPKSPERSFASPRTWEFVSQVLFTNDDPTSLVDVMSGTIGEGLALKFMAHRKHSESMPHPDQILAGKVKDLKVKEISAQYSLITSCCYKLKALWDEVGKTKQEQNYHDAASNFLAFAMIAFNKEVVVMGMNIALSNFDLPFSGKKIAAFDDFFKQYGSFIMKASALA